jgi:hypothetical protein
MHKADYDHYCLSKITGPISYEQTGKCFRQDECTKIVKDFKRMHVKTTSEVRKKLGEV